MRNVTINVARDFSKYPIGRHVGDGKFTGERFREEFLVPALDQGNNVTLQLDGTLGYGSSFLEEAFGGLVRERGLTVADLNQRLQFATEDEDLIYTIRRYIEEAGARILVSR